jgi:HPt (histidine-containing phosphotransfer) domain-containing protein
MIATALQLPVLDRARMNEVFEGDVGACRELLDMFIADAQLQTHTVELSVGTQQFDEVIRAAHTLKGAAANVGALRLAETARELERAARDRDAEHAARVAADVAIELRLLTEEAARSRP